MDTGGSEEGQVAQLVTERGRAPVGPHIGAGLGAGLQPPGREGEQPPPAIDRVPARLATTIGVHTVVDAFSFISVSLLPLFVTSLSLSDAQRAMLLAANPLFSGIIQPVVAWVSDKLDTRLLGTAGFAMAVLSVGAFGFARDFETLLALQCLAASGVGAFHPPAAAAAGRLSGRKRSLGVAVFFLAGMSGGVIGNIGAPHYVGAFTPVLGGVERIGVGLKALAWLVIPGMVAVLALGWAIHNVPHRHHGAHDHHSSLSPDERKRRWFSVALLYIASIIRFTVNNALVALYVIWAERFVLQRAEAEQLNETLALQASQINGLMQGAMQVGMGGAGLALGFILRARHEKPALVLVPAIGSIAVFVAPYADRSPALVVVVAFILAVLTGIGFGSLVPVSISVAQRLLPHRSSLASGLMMGGAWCFAAAGPYIATGAYHAFGLDRAFHITAGMLVLAAVVGAVIPSRTILESDA